MKENFEGLMMNKKMYRVLKFSVLIVLLGFILLVLTLEPRITGYETYQATTLEDGWVQIIEGEAHEIEGTTQTIDMDGDVILECTVPEIIEGEMLLFYSQNQEISVYVEGELIYEFLMRENLEFLGSPGSLWNEIPLTTDMSGKTIRIEIGCDFSRYSNQIGEIYITHNSGKILVEWQQSWFQSFVGIFILLLAIMGYIRGNRIWSKERRRMVLLTADLYLWVGIWVLAECGFMDTFLRRPIISYVVAMISIRAIPVVFLAFLMMNIKRYTRVLKNMYYVMWINLIISIMLQFICRVSFLDTLFVNNILLLIASLICIVYLAGSIMEDKGRIFSDSFFLCVCMLFIGGAVDLYLYFLNYHYTKGIGIGVCCAIVIYTGVELYLYIEEKEEVEKQRKALEDELNLVKYTAMSKQIKAHFLNNTLNSISALCKENPREADRAIKVFSQYMRANMYLVEQREPIPFEKEMTLVNTYVTIERMRFEDRFQIRVDEQFSEFKVPPLSIQPIIENALLHGLKDRVVGGEVSITSRREGDYAKVIIQDNGMGFDIEEIEKGESLGLKNIKKRVEILSDGRVEIESELNKGTSITIIVPIDK